MYIYIYIYNYYYTYIYIYMYLSLSIPIPEVRSRTSFCLRGVTRLDDRKPKHDIVWPDVPT